MQQQLGELELTTDAPQPHEILPGDLLELYGESDRGWMLEMDRSIRLLEEISAAAVRWESALETVESNLVSARTLAASFPAAAEMVDVAETNISKRARTLASLNAAKPKATLDGEPAVALAYSDGETAVLEVDGEQYRLTPGQTVRIEGRRLTLNAITPDGVAVVYAGRKHNL